jgi:hypothetical protein
MARILRRIGVVLLMPYLLLINSISAASVLTQSIDFESYSDGEIVGATGIASFDHMFAVTAGLSLNEFEVPPRSGANVALNDDAAVTITFSQGINHFIGYITYGAPIKITTYGSQGVLRTIESKFTSNLALSGDRFSTPNEEFSFDSANLITSIIFKSSSAGMFALDDISISTDDLPPPSQVPEPDSLYLVLLGIFLFVARQCSRTWFRPRYGCALLALGWNIVAHAQVSLSELAVYPQNVLPKTPVVITVILPIPEATYITGSAVLNQVDESNKVIRRLATFSDDGSGGDDVAGDKQFTARFTINQGEIKPFRIAASVGYSGSLTRITSPAAIIWVTADAGSNKDIALIQTGNAVFKDEGGKTVSTIKLAQYELSNVSLPAGPAIETRVESAFTSESQQRLGIITSRWINMQGEHEGSAIRSQFRYFNSAGSLLFSIDSRPENFFFTDSSLEFSSKDGKHLILIDVEENNTSPIVRYLDDAGNLLAEYSSFMENISEAKLSSNGRYIAAIGDVTGSNGPQVLVVLIDTATNAISRKTFDVDTEAAIAVEEDLSGSFSVIVGDTIVEKMP